MEEIKVKNLKIGWAIAKNSSGDLFAYDPNKFHLFKPDEMKRDDEIVSLYIMDSEGAIDYEYETRLPITRVIPMLIRLIDLDFKGIE